MTRPLTFALAALTLAACGAGAPSSTPVALLGTASADGLTATLSAAVAPAAGLTTLLLELEGAALGDEAVVLRPQLVNGAQRTGCPVLGPGVRQPDGRYRAEVVLHTPSSAEAQWHLEADVTRGGATKTLAFGPLDVAAGTHVATFEAPAHHGAPHPVKHVVSLSFPEGARVGVNQARVTMHALHDALTYEPVDDFAVDLVPEMPAHGHGSSGNVAPTRRAPGDYLGVLNLSMPGRWVTTATQRHGDAVLGSVVFETKL